jgi:hypothetical protein
VVITVKAMTARSEAAATIPFPGPTAVIPAPTAAAAALTTFINLQPAHVVVVEAEVTPTLLKVPMPAVAAVAAATPAAVAAVAPVAMMLAEAMAAVAEIPEQMPVAVPDASRMPRVVMAVMPIIPVAGLIQEPPGQALKPVKVVVAGIPPGGAQLQAVAVAVASMELRP